MRTRPPRSSTGAPPGSIAPYVETAKQVRSLTTAARYRPLKGDRASAAVRNPDTLEPQLREYLDNRNADTIFIANIESVPAIENLDDTRGRSVQKREGKPSEFDVAIMPLSLEVHFDP